MEQTTNNKQRTTKNTLLVRIFLIGFMGCGKTHIGKRLAKKLGLSFIDMDDFVEKKENRSIRTIFAEEGENYFRKKEKECLREMANFESTIIATGGGAPCFFDNGDWMNTNGLTVYLQTPTEVIMKNLERGIAKRPLLNGLSKKELNAFVKNKIAEREAFYQNVHIIYERQIGGDEAVKELSDYFGMFKL